MGSFQIVVQIEAPGIGGFVSFLGEPLIPLKADTSLTPNTSTRTVSFQADDGSAANDLTNVVSRLINVTLTNVPPILSSVSIAPLAYTEKDPAAKIAPTIAVADSDSTNLFGATIQITGNYATGQDRLDFSNTLAVNWTWEAASGKLTLIGKASVAGYQSLLQSVTYHNVSYNPSGLTRTVSFIVNDGIANSNVVIRSIAVTPVNDPPTLSNIETMAIAFLQGNPAMAITSSLLVADPDSDNLTGAKIVLGANYQFGQDLLSFVNTAKIIGIWKAASGTLTLYGTDTVSNYRAALRSVKFVNASPNLSPLSRTVTFQVSDRSTGEMNSNRATRDITVRP